MVFCKIWFIDISVVVTVVWSASNPKWLSRGHLGMVKGALVASTLNLLHCSRNLISSGICFSVLVCTFPFLELLYTMRGEVSDIHIEKARALPTQFPSVV